MMDGYASEADCQAGVQAVNNNVIAVRLSGLTNKVSQCCTTSRCNSLTLTPPSPPPGLPPPSPPKQSPPATSAPASLQQNSLVTGVLIDTWTKWLAVGMALALGLLQHW